MGERQSQSIPGRMSSGSRGEAFERGGARRRGPAISTCVIVRKQERFRPAGPRGQASKLRRAGMIVCGGALLAAGLARTAAAGELCVTCDGPPMTYRCVFGEAVATKTDDPRAQMLCITELAKFGHHESCAVDHRQPAQCPGALRAVSPPDVAAELPPLAKPPAGPMGTPVPMPVQEGEKGDHGPRTVEELAKQTAKSTGKELGKAGDAVKDTVKDTAKGAGNVAKKSWRCLMSLFTDC